MFKKKSANRAIRQAPIKTTLAGRLREAVRWRSVKHVLLFNTLIAVGLTLTDFRGLDRLGLVLGSHLIYAMSIGCGIYFFSYLLDLDQIKNRLVYILSITGVFLLGGLLGALLAVWLTTTFLGLHNPLTNLSPFLMQVVLYSIFFGFLGFAYFYFQEQLRITAARLAEKEITEQKLMRMKTEAELDALRAKVRPHFLFNALNSLASLVHSDPDLAEDLVQKLANLLRFAIKSGKSEWVTLAQEIELIQAYLSIEKARLGPRLTFEIEIPPDLERLAIPVLLLQPLVENSVKHGIAPKREGGHLSVRCSDQGARYRVAIEDNGRGWAPEAQEDGFGLRGVQERLALHFDDDYALKIESNDGVRLTIDLPKRDHAT